MPSRAERSNPGVDAALTWEVDPEHQVTILRLVGDVDGRAVRARIEEFWRDHPESIANHCVVDTSGYVGDLGYDDLTAIAMQWRKHAQGRDAGRGTAIVTHDRFARLLMSAVALLFPMRRFELFAEMGEARDWIETIS